MPYHRPHRKEAMAARVRRPKVRRWLLKLDRLFIEVKMQRKGKK